jgi:hypothetical protein
VLCHPSVLPRHCSWRWSSLSLISIPQNDFSNSIVIFQMQAWFMNIALFWNMMPCSLINIYQCFQRMIAGVSEVLINIYQTTQWHILKYRIPHSHRCENNKSHNFLIEDLYAVLWNNYHWRKVGNCNTVIEVNDYCTVVFHTVRAPEIHLKCEKL